MPDYHLNGLDPRAFEQIVQAIAKKEIANGVTPFGDGPDGGREATFTGRMNYPSATAPWGGYLVKVDEASDLALLKAAGNFSALPVADSRKVNLGSPVMTVGFPDPSLLGFSVKFSKGDIAALAGAEDEPVNFQISVPIQPGNSGGALLDGCGNVVGIVSQGIDKKQALDCNGNVLENVNYAVKSQYLLRLLESVPEVASKLKPAGTEEKKSEDISTSAEKASVMILIYGMKL